MPSVQKLYGVYPSYFSPMEILQNAIILFTVISQFLDAHSSLTLLNEELIVERAPEMERFVNCW